MSNPEGSLLNISDAMDVEDLHVLPEGEHRLEVTSAEVRTQKPEKGTSQFILARFQPCDDPNAKDITHCIMLADGEGNDREDGQRNRRLKDFVTAVGAEGDELDLSAILGAQVQAALGIQTSEQYGEQNSIRRFLV